MAKLTLIGLYDFDNTIFDNLSLPSAVNKQTLIENILMRSGDFEVLYPDPDFLKFSIGAWSRKWRPTFDRWVNVLSIKYSPLENYDRTEHWTDTGSGEESGSTSGNSSGSTSGTTDSTTTGKVSAYDGGDTFTNRDQSVIDGEDSSTSSSTSSTTSSGSHSNTSEHDGHVHGNIGVMSSQNMLMQELDVGYWNIYEKITDIFLTEFVIPVY